jgi:hypothetical protein
MKRDSRISKFALLAGFALLCPAIRSQGAVMEFHLQSDFFIRHCIALPENTLTETINKCFGDK